jgi:hypothetical protein
VQLLLYQQCIPPFKTWRVIQTTQMIPPLQTLRMPMRLLQGKKIQRIVHALQRNVSLPLESWQKSMEARKLRR